MPLVGSSSPPPSYYSTQNGHVAAIRRQLLAVRPDGPMYPASPFTTSRSAGMNSSTSPRAYVRPESDEQTPLNGARKQRRSSSSPKVAFALNALIFVLVLGMSLGLSGIILVSQRASWKLEQREIEKEFRHEKELWLQEQMEKERDLERKKAMWRNEEAERERTRRQWAIEEIRMDRKHEEWADEDKAREEDEQRRIGAGLRWTEVQPLERCLRFGTREYSAQLLNVPDYLRMEEKTQWCYRTGVEIHGRRIETPNRCEVVQNGNQQSVYARWTVSVGEPTCETWWEGFSDEGCVTAGSRKRRIRAKLGNHLPPWDNWKEMCATTPVDMLGRHFDQPDACNNWALQGTIGFWFIHDESC